MNDFLDFFNYAFFYRALIMSFLSGISCGIVGVWLLLLNMSFIGVVIAHCAFAGAIIGLFYEVIKKSAEYLLIYEIICIFATEKNKRE